jgi:hypothetical protein
MSIGWDELILDYNFFINHFLAPTVVASFCKAKDIADGGNMIS